MLDQFLPTSIDDPLVVGFVLGVACSMYAVRVMRTGSLSLRPPPRPPPKRNDSDDDPPTLPDRRR